MPNQTKGSYYMRFKSTATLVALIAALSVSAAAVASASAASPEFKPVPAKKKFTGSGNGITSIFNNESLICTGSSVTGELASAQALGKVGLVLTGCKSSGQYESNCPVSSVGAKAGEIVTKPLAAELGTVAKAEAPSSVGLRFKPETKTAWFTMVGNTCTMEAVVSGSVAAEVVTVGKRQLGNELRFKLIAGHQAIEKITLDSGTLEEPVLTTATRGMTLEAATALTFEEALEVT